MFLVKAVEYICESACGEAYSVPEQIGNLISLIYKIIQIGVPLILIIVGMVDLTKSIMQKNEDEVKKARQLLIKKGITAALIFLMFSLVMLLMNVLSKDDQDIFSCVSCYINGEDADAKVAYEEKKKREEKPEGKFLTNGSKIERLILQEGSSNNTVDVLFEYEDTEVPLVVKNVTIDQDKIKISTYKMSSGNLIKISLTYGRISDYVNYGVIANLKVQTDRGTYSLPITINNSYSISFESYDNGNVKCDIVQTGTKAKLTKYKKGACQIKINTANEKLFVKNNGKYEEYNGKIYSVTNGYSKTFCIETGQKIYYCNTLEVEELDGNVKFPSVYFHSIDNVIEMSGSLNNGEEITEDICKNINLKVDFDEIGSNYETSPIIGDRIYTSGAGVYEPTCRIWFKLESMSNSKNVFPVIVDSGNLTLEYNSRKIAEDTAATLIPYFDFSGLQKYSKGVTINYTEDIESHLIGKDIEIYGFYAPISFWGCSDCNFTAFNDRNDFNDQALDNNKYNYVSITGSNGKSVKIYFNLKNTDGDYSIEIADYEGATYLIATIKRDAPNGPVELYLGTSNIESIPFHEITLKKKEESSTPSDDEDDEENASLEILDVKKITAEILNVVSHSASCYYSQNSNLQIFSDYDKLDQLGVCAAGTEISSIVDSKYYLDDYHFEIQFYPGDKSEGSINEEATRRIFLEISPGNKIEITSWPRFYETTSNGKVVSDNYLYPKVRIMIPYDKIPIYFSSLQNSNCGQDEIYKNNDCIDADDSDVDNQSMGNANLYITGVQSDY